MKPRAVEKTTEALRKTPKELIEDMHIEITYWNDDRSSLRSNFAFAALLAVLAEQADKSTKKIIYLTWAIVGLTIALLILTAYLCQDVYTTREREKKADKYHSEHDKAKIPIE